LQVQINFGPARAIPLWPGCRSISADTPVTVALRSAQLT